MLGATEPMQLAINSSEIGRSQLVCSVLLNNFIYVLVLRLLLLLHLLMQLVQLDEITVDCAFDLCVLACAAACASLR